MEDTRRSTDLADEFAREPRLSDPGWPEDGHENRRALRDRPLETSEQLSQLFLPSNEGGVETTGERGYALDDFEEAVDANWLGLPLEREWLDCLDLDGVTNQPVGLLAEQDLARFGGLLETGGDVDRIAAGVELAAGGIARHHFTCVDPGSDGKGDPVLALKALVQALRSPSASLLPPSPHAGRRPRARPGSRTRPRPHRR